MCTYSRGERDVSMFWTSHLPFKKIHLKNSYFVLQDLASFQNRHLPLTVMQKDKKNRLRFFCGYHKCTRSQILLCNKTNLPHVHLVLLCIYPQRTRDVLYTDTMSDSTSSNTQPFWSLNVLDDIIWEGGLKVLGPTGMLKLATELGKQSICPP